MPAYRACALMLKPASLRAALAAVAPVLDADATMLRMWVEKGKIVARRSANRSFEYRYTLSVVVVGWTGPPEVLFLAINQWLELNQPDLLAGGRDESYSFDVDIIDSATIDLAMELALSEPVAVMDGGGGQFELIHLPEAPLFGDAQQEPPPPPLTSIWYQGAQLIPEPSS